VGRALAISPLMARHTSCQSGGGHRRAGRANRPQSSSASWSGGRRQGPSGHSSQASRPAGSQPGKPPPAAGAGGRLAHDPTRVWNLPPPRAGGGPAAAAPQRPRGSAPAPSISPWGQDRADKRAAAKQRIGLNQHGRLQSPGQGKTCWQGPGGNQLGQHSGSNQGLAEVGISSPSLRLDIQNQGEPQPLSGPKGLIKAPRPCPPTSGCGKQRGLAATSIQ